MMPAMHKTLFGLVCACAVSACGPSGDAKSAADEPTDSSADATSTSTTDMPPPEDGSSTTEPAGASAATEAKPTEAPPPSLNEKQKEPNALVLSLSYMMKGGAKADAATSKELEKAALERIATSTKLASATSKVDQPRPVNVTVLIEEPTDGKKGLTVKMGLVGVEPAGKCPLFDIDQNFTMSDAKKTNADDVLSLRRSAIQALLDKLEQSASTLKPTANCTAFRK